MLTGVRKAGMCHAPMTEPEKKAGQIGYLTSHKHDGHVLYVYCVRLLTAAVVLTTTDSCQCFEIWGGYFDCHCDLRLR